MVRTVGLASSWADKMLSIQFLLSYIFRFGSELQLRKGNVERKCDCSGINADCSYCGGTGYRTIPSAEEEKGKRPVSLTTDIPRRTAKKYSKVLEDHDLVKRYKPPFSGQTGGRSTQIEVWCRPCSKYVGLVNYQKHMKKRHSSVL